MKAESKFLAELTKAEMAASFVEKTEKIKALKFELKKLETEASAMEEILLPQIGVKYQPKGANFILMPKITNGRKSTAYAKVVEEAPKICRLSDKQTTLLKELVESQTNYGEDKKTIQIVK